MEANSGNSWLFFFGRGGVWGPRPRLAPEQCPRLGGWGPGVWTGMENGVFWGSLKDGLCHESFKAKVLF